MSITQSVADQYIVKFTPDAVGAGTDFKGLARALGSDLLDETPNGLQLWSIPAAHAGAALEALQNNPLVERVEQNMEVTLAETPNDPKFPNQWALDTSSDIDLDAQQGWDIRTDASGVTVAVIDTGVDIAHPDLDDNIWTNPGEIAGNGKDDDGNGYIDDIHGWDFVNGDNMALDDHSHGTHVAGSIAAEGNNGIGTTGVAWNSNIMALKAFSSSGSGSTYNIAKAIDYATAMGADVSNNSWRLTSFSYSVDDAIKRAAAGDHLVVMGAGNDGKDVDGTGYSAAMTHANMLTVTAHTSSGAKPSWANWGAESIDLAAPGTSILSTMPGGGYGSKSGTSMATPHAAGVAALIRAADPSLSAVEVRKLIMANVDPLASMEGITVTGGRLNLAKALSSFTSTVSAKDDKATTDEDTAVSIDVLANDPSGLTITGTGAAGHGVVSVAADGSHVVYTPDKDYSGADSFEYSVSDGKGGVGRATVSVSVSPVNDAPVAVDDAARTSGGASVTVDVLANDRDADGDALSVKSITQPDAGTLTLNAEGTLTWTPGSFIGTTTASYVVTDPSGETDTGILTLEATSTADAITLTGTDYRDVMDVSTASTPYILDARGGSDVLSGGSGNDTLIGGSGDDQMEGGAGDDVFQWAGEGNGTDTVDGGTGYDVVRGTAGDEVIGLNALTGVEAIDGGGGNDVIAGSDWRDVLDLSAMTVTGTVVLDGRGGNDILTGNAADNLLRGSNGHDNITGGAGTDTALYAGQYASYKISLISGGLQVKGEGTDTLYGVERLQFADGVWQDGAFEPMDGGGGGGDDDGSDGTDPGNTAPVAADDSVSTTTGSSVTFDARSNDTDAEGDALTVSSVTQPDNGSLSVGSDGLLTWDPGTFVGTTTATYTVTDTGGLSDTATITLEATESVDAETLVGTEYRDTMDVSGQTTSYILDGRGGADLLTGGGGNDTLIGGGHSDAMDGGAGDDVFLVTGTGNGVDAVTGGTGFDVLRGGGGNDEMGVSSLAGVELVDGAGGTDVIHGSDWRDYLDFSTVEVRGIAVIDGRGGNDVLTGNAADNVMRGGTGSDQMDGGDGFDTALFDGTYASHTIDTVSGGLQVTGSGTDVLSGFERLQFSDGVWENGVFTSGVAAVDTSDLLLA